MSMALASTKRKTTLTSVLVRKAATIGARNMGVLIASLLTTVGIPSLLMDVVPSELTTEKQKRGLIRQWHELQFAIRA